MASDFADLRRALGDIDSDSSCKPTTTELLSEIEAILRDGRENDNSELEYWQDSLMPITSDEIDDAVDAIFHNIDKQTKYENASPPSAYDIAYNLLTRSHATTRRNINAHALQEKTNRQ